MSEYVRTCPTAQGFNTGGSYCPIDPSKVRAIIFFTLDYGVPTDPTMETLQGMCHGDRPYRYYPIKNIVEYAPSGGEAQIETIGYGAPKIVGYSQRTDTFTLGTYDIELVKNIMRLKSQKVYVVYVDEDNQIHGITKEGIEDVVFGVPATMHVTDQPFDTSSTHAKTEIVISLSDTETFMKNRVACKWNFDVQMGLIGLMNVRFVSAGGGHYKLVDSSNTNIGSVYRDSLSTEHFVNATTVEYDVANDWYTIQCDGEPKLKSAQELFKANVSGIEQL